MKLRYSALFTLLTATLFSFPSSAAQVEYIIRKCESERCSEVRNRRIQLTFRKLSERPSRPTRDVLFDQARIDGLEFLLSGWTAEPNEKWPHESDELMIQVLGPKKNSLHHSEFVFFAEKDENHLHLPVHTAQDNTRYTVEVRQVD